MQSGQLSQATPGLGTCPYSLSQPLWDAWPSSQFHPSARWGPIFSVLRLQPFYPLHHFWHLRQPLKSKQIQKRAIHGVQESQTDPQMIDLVVAAGPGCRQTANEVIFLNAKCKQDNSSLPLSESLWVSLPFFQFSAEMHIPACILYLYELKCVPSEWYAGSPNAQNVALFGDGVFSEVVELKWGH